MSSDLQRAVADDAIDRVAREMTSGAPSASFRREVVARLESPRPARVGWPMIAAAAAMAAVAIVAFAMWPPSNHSAPPAITMTTAPAPIFVPPPAQPPAAADGVDHTSRTPQRRTSGASSFEPTIPGLPPIERLEPITQPSIQPERLSIPQLRIDAIVMPPVDDGGSVQE